jgi:Sulfakinin family
MNSLTVFLLLGISIFPAIVLTAVLDNTVGVLGKTSADADSVREDKTSGSATSNVKVAAYQLGPGSFKRDPFADYGHFRFGKRVPQPSFADYGHLRFGRRGPQQPSYADYGHLRFGRSTLDEAEVYQHDFDDINDVE